MSWDAKTYLENVKWTYVAFEACILQTMKGTPPLRRKIDHVLDSWRERQGHLPLFLDGARQVGKTTSVRLFGGRRFESFVEINFATNPEFRRAFSTSSVERILQELTFINPGFRFLPGRTLILLDEIQTCVEAMTSAKPFAEDGRFDVIYSGSALGVANYISPASVPVGYRESLRMFPLDFEEFLWSRGYGDGQIPFLKERLLSMEPLGSAVLDPLLRHYRDYLAIGGMPAIVRAFAETGDFGRVYSLQGQLREDYSQDIRQYAEGLDRARIGAVYESIVPQLGKENHKFQYSKIAHGSRFKDYAGCLEWLEAAGVINIVCNVRSLALPLKAYEDSGNFRAYFADEALVMGFLDEDAQRRLRVENDLGIYGGALYEGAVLGDLKKAGLGDVFFRRTPEGTLELDFLVERRGAIVPIEVKAKGGRAVSLKAVLTRHPDIPFGIQMGQCDISFDGRVVHMPHALAFLLPEFLKAFSFSEGE